MRIFPHSFPTSLPKWIFPSSDVLCSQDKPKCKSPKCLSHKKGRNVVLFCNYLDKGKIIVVLRWRMLLAWLDTDVFGGFIWVSVKYMTSCFFSYKSFPALLSHLNVRYGNVAFCGHWNMRKFCHFHVEFSGRGSHEVLLFLPLCHGDYQHFRWWLLCQPGYWHEDNEKSNPQPTLREINLVIWGLFFTATSLSP